MSDIPWEVRAALEKAKDAAVCATPCERCGVRIDPAHGYIESGPKCLNDLACAVRVLANVMKGRK